MPKALISEDLVVVELARQRYAVSVRRVREVVPRATLTSLPGAPDGVLGILSLRGSLLPVLDLRHRLDLPSMDVRISQCLLIVELARSTVGLLVDAVVGIVAGPHDGPTDASAGPTERIRAVHQIDGKVVSVLDVDLTVGPTIAAYVAGITAPLPMLPDAHGKDAEQEGVRR